MLIKAVCVKWMNSYLEEAWLDSFQYLYSHQRGIHAYAFNKCGHMFRQGDVVLWITHFTAVCILHWLIKPMACIKDIDAKMMCATSKVHVFMSNLQPELNHETTWFHFESTNFDFNFSPKATQKCFIIIKTY